MPALVVAIAYVPGSLQPSENNLYFEEWNSILTSIAAMMAVAAAGQSMFLQSAPGQAVQIGHV